MWRRLWHRAERYVIYHSIRLFRLRSATEHVARGFAVGLVVNFYPTFGVGMLISGVIAKLAGGSVVAGLVGGASLALLWPLLYYLNLRTGSLFVRPAIAVEDFEDINSGTMNALLWGQTFTWGALVNSVVVGVTTYALMRLLYERVRPGALTFFRQHARDHQHRLRHLKDVLPGPLPGTRRGERSSEDPPDPQ